jgi:hypothetical protein
MALNRGSMRQQITKGPQKKKFVKARKGKLLSRQKVVKKVK